MFTLVLTSQSLFFCNFGLFWFVFDLWINYKFKLKITLLLMINQIDLSLSLCFEYPPTVWNHVSYIPCACLISECSQNIISIMADFVL